VQTILLTPSTTPLPLPSPPASSGYIEPVLEPPAVPDLTVPLAPPTAVIPLDTPPPSVGMPEIAPLPSPTYAIPSVTKPCPGHDPPSERRPSELFSPTVRGRGTLPLKTTGSLRLQRGLASVSSQNPHDRRLCVCGLIASRFLCCLMGHASIHGAGPNGQPIPGSIGSGKMETLPTAPGSGG
jgi:hypothetical protein